MKYIAITRQTASWMLTRPKLIVALHDLIVQDDQLLMLRCADLTEGPFRLSGYQDGKLLAIWHLDYLTGTGTEEWGFIKLSSPFGLLDRLEFSQEVLERSLYLVNQRLQGLLIDSVYYHRNWDNGAQTCLAGRGTETRHSSIGYCESDVALGSMRSHAIMCVGPSEDLDDVSRAAAEEGRNLPALVKLANEMIAPQRRRPVLNRSLFASLRDKILNQDAASNQGLEDITVSSLSVPTARDVYRTLGWKYDEWLEGSSPLSAAQRRIIESDGILEHPIRIMGPGGSGKTLLMQLLAVRRLLAAQKADEDVRVLYVVHNAPMAKLVRDRFEILGVGNLIEGQNKQSLNIATLSEYGKSELQLSDTGIIDVDAHETKLFQLDEVKKALKRALAENIEEVRDSQLLSQIAQNEDLFAIFARLVMAEISTAIKGHGLTSDKQRYVGSERQLSRLHGLLSLGDRGVVFEAFRHYHRSVFEEMEVLDTDDIALSLLGKMRTPIWELKRRTLGYDYVFVDETQLFNENERRLFPLLTKDNRGYVPIILALDAAQELYGQSSAGFGALGIQSMSNESLPSNHRSTRAIVDLAFFVIQQTTDLFGADFPDFTESIAVLEADEHPLALPPEIEMRNEETKSFPKFVEKRIRELRKGQVRQIAVICHAEHYWESLVSELRATDLPLQILVQRGDRLAANQPLVVLTRPAYVGGQEFDAVIAVGLEQGLVPPRIHDNEALASAVEQQALREIYLSFTRARYQLRVLIDYGTTPTKVVQNAANARLIRRRTQ